MLMTPPPTSQYAPAAMNRQPSPTLNFTGRQNPLSGATPTGIGAGLQKLGGNAFPGGIPGLSQNPMDLQGQQMQMAKLLQGGR